MSNPDRKVHNYSHVSRRREIEIGGISSLTSTGSVKTLPYGRNDKLTLL